MRDATEFDQIRQAIASNVEDMISTLHRYVELETPTGDREASQAIATLLERRHRALGGTVATHDGSLGRHLVIDHQGDFGTKPLLLIGHSDTVWNRGTLDTTVPWLRTDGTIAGPGAFDMKSGLVMIETAIDALRELGIPFHRARIVITCDEEIGSPTSTPLVVSAASDALAAIGFESPHPDGAFKTGRRGSTRLRVAVEGREAHAALDPEKGVSAIDELIDQLLSVRAFVASVELKSPGSVLCNVGSITGGERANVVPGHAEAVLGLRFTTGDVEREVLDTLSRLVPVREGAFVSTTVLSHRPAWLTSDADRALLDSISTTAGALGLTVAGRPAAGAGDTNTVGSLGLPTIDGFGPIGGGAHAVTEHFSIDSFVDRTVLLAGILAQGVSFN